MYLRSRVSWVAYTKAEEAMLEQTHIPKRHGPSSRPWTKSVHHLNCIAHLLRQFLFEEIVRPEVVLPERVHRPHDIRAPISKEIYIPSRYELYAGPFRNPSRT